MPATEFQIRPATRQAVKVLMCIYGESGTGKTPSALLLARGFVGPKGKIVMIDTEHGRGSAYAGECIEGQQIGDYDVLELGEPFTPERYVEAVKVVEDWGAQIGIIDSASHCWENIGGVLDQAHKIEEKTGKRGLHCWAPKFDNRLFLLRLTQSPMPWIVCLRAYYKTRQAKNQKGETVIVTDTDVTPIQQGNFIYEMMMHGRINQDHTFTLIKPGPPSLARLLPNGCKITIKHGEAVARWCESAGQIPKAQKNELANLLSTLRSITAPIHKWTLSDGLDAWKIAKKTLEQWLWDESIISDIECLDELTPDRVKEVITVATKKLTP